MARRPSPDPAALAASKRASTAQLLFKCARLVNERAMARVNARAGMFLGRVEASVFVNNLFNKAYRVYAFDGSLYWGDTLGVYAKPRTWGVSMKYNFGK